MGLYALTGLSPEIFQKQAVAARVLLFHPQAAHRITYFSYILQDTEKQTIYHRFEKTQPHLVEALASLYDNLRSQTDSTHFEFFRESLSQKQPQVWGQQLAEGLNAHAKQAQPVILFLDELDFVNQNEKFDEFVLALANGLGDRAQVAICSRMLKRQPWYQLISQGRAEVFGMERRAHNGMFTKHDRPRPILEVFAFGRGYAFIDGQEINNWDGALPRNLFFYFVDNLLVTRDDIFNVFWPNLPTKEATNVFHVTKRKISERITDKANESGAYELTQYGSGFYRPSDKIVRYYDVHEFESAVERAMLVVEDDAQEEALLLQAIELYRGAFLQETHMAWMNDRRNALRQLYAQALIGIGRLCKRRGDWTSAIGYFGRALKETPEREDIHRDMMQLYIDHQMYDAARSQYHMLANYLNSKLKISPSKETRTLFESLMVAH